MGLSSGAYIGIIIGIVVFIVLKTACIIVLWRRKNNKHRSRILSSSSTTMSSQQTSELLNYIEKWEIRCDDVKLIKRPDGSDWELGSGAFGRVVLGLRGGVQEVAIKMLYNNAQKEQGSFLREISMLKFVARDRNVVQFYGVSIQNNGIWLITEFMRGGDLRNALTADGDAQVTWWNRGKQIACDVAKGLAFLHSNKVIHSHKGLDDVLLLKTALFRGMFAKINLGNGLYLCIFPHALDNLSKDGEAKITDVGMAKLMSEAYYTQDNNIGTFAWAAPEILMGEKCSEKVDCYSLGVTCWEIASGLMPVRGKMDTPSPKECPPEVAVLISDLMRRDPRLRPSAAEAYRRLKAAEPNPEIVPLPEELADVPSDVVTGPKGNATTWQTDLDSAGEIDSRQANLMQLADGASHEVTMMENSFMHLAVPERKTYMAGSWAAKEASILDFLAKDPKVAVDRNPFEPQAADKGSHIPQVADEENLLHLAKDASAAVTQMDPTTAPPTAVNGGKSRGIKLSKAQRDAIDRQDGLTTLHHTDASNQTVETDLQAKDVNSAEFLDSLQNDSVIRR